MSEPLQQAALEEIGPGAMLARERTARGLALAEVAGRLKYGARQIEALEADDFAKLPGATIVRGMIRSYARLLNADCEPILKAFERRHVPCPVSVDLSAKRIPFPDGRPRSTRVYLALSMLIVVAVAAVLYEWSPPELFAETPAPKAAAITQLAVAPQAPMSAAQASSSEVEEEPAQEDALGDGRILIEFQKESWVEVRDRLGKTLLSQLNPGGSHRVVEGEPPFRLVIGNAANVRLTYKNAPVDLRPYIKVEVARLTLE